MGACVWEFRAGVAAGLLLVGAGVTKSGWPFSLCLKIPILSFGAELIQDDYE